MKIDRTILIQKAEFTSIIDGESNVVITVVYEDKKELDLVIPNKILEKLYKQWKDIQCPT
jgi:hypothetical protein